MPVESLHKGLELLEALCVSVVRSVNGVSLADLAVQMGWKRTTTHNLLKTLALCGYAESVGDGRYVPGWRVADLARMAWLGRPVPSAVADIVSGLSVSLKEAVVVAVLAHSRRHVMVRSEGTHVVRVDAESYDTVDKALWATVTGRVLAAHCGAAELAALSAAAGDPSPWWPEVCCPTDLSASLAHIREMGFAADDDGNVVSFAVPIMGPKGVLLGALGTYLPCYRYQQSRRLDLLSALNRSAVRLADSWFG